MIGGEKDLVESEACEDKEDKSQLSLDKKG